MPIDTTFLCFPITGFMLNRNLPKILISYTPFEDDIIQEKRNIAKERFSLLDDHFLPFFVRTGALENHAYKAEGGGIPILNKDGQVKDMSEVTDNYNLDALKDTVTKYYLTYWK